MSDEKVKKLDKQAQILFEEELNNYKEGKTAFTLYSSNLKKISNWIDQKGEQ